METHNLLDIIKSTLRALRQKNMYATPNAYAKEFSNQAKEFKSQISEFKELEEILKKLYTKYPTLQHKKIDTFYELSKELLKAEKKSPNYDLEYFLENLAEMIAPSINHQIDSEIKKTIKTIKTNPIHISSKEIVDKLKDISHQRIKLDRKVIKDKTEDIVKLTKLMGKYFDKALIESGNSLSEINKIKSELDELHLSSTSKRELFLLQNSLVDTIYELGHNLRNSQEQLVENKTQFSQMQEYIIKLQTDLSEIKKENNIDFLTGVLNRRAYDTEIEKIESQYELFSNNYAIVFIDIDHFKSINDTHGHSCGDVILKTFASMLNVLTRDGDLVVRYGGEEFVSLIKYDHVDDVKKYAKRIKKVIEENNFIFNDLKFKIKFSAGVAYREKYTTYDEAVKVADNLMYEAKKTGREKIIFDDNHII
ncbi:MAG: GGDEF domain-containing protein [Candidatus Marinarcus sp.]|uniref:GGDEF domain-containing protein n=1 Tax=Candidatus Marinarcus sp. TaxID=3100987 RepID=UPI003B009212